MLLALAAALLAPTPLRADVACDLHFQFFWDPLPNDDPRPINCQGAFRCHKAEELGLLARTTSDTCDPNVQTCGMQFGVNFLFPGVKAMIADADTITEVPTPRIEWRNPQGDLFAVCGLEGSQISADFVNTYVEFGNLDCADVTFPTLVFDVRAVGRDGDAPQDHRHRPAGGGVHSSMGN